MLIINEHQWYWIFHGLVFGVPAAADVSWEPSPPPRPPRWSGIPELDEERRIFWMRKMTSPASWKVKRPSPPPKLSGNREVDEERIRDWRREIVSTRGWREVRTRSKGRRPAEPEVWEQVKRAQKPNQIREACDTSPFWLNPTASRSPLVGDLRIHASEFLAAKKYRYPKSNRPSSEEKRILHFARAMAGITQGISPARGIDLLRNLEHGKNCQCVSCMAKRYRTTL